MTHAPFSTTPATRRSRGRGRTIRRLFGVFCLILGFAVQAQGVLGQTPGEVRVLTIDGMINPITERYLTRGIEEASASGAALLLLELDTPGGLLESTQRMTSAILRSEVPIAVYVTPEGGRAASAGVFITMSGNIAAMAPNTRIGAATPVDGAGGDIDEDLARKIINDTVVYARSIAETRERNADWVEDAVRDAVVVNATEAVDLDVVDLVATSRADLLQQIDGMTVTTRAGEVVLATADAPISEEPLSAFEELFMAIANPNIALLLLSLGGIALYFELANPGAMIPGIVGVIFLILAFLSLGALPISAAGLALLVVGLALLGAELFVASGGILGIGGVIAFGLGGLLLIDETQSPVVEVSRPLIIGLTVSMGAFVMVALRGVMRARRRPVAIGDGDMSTRLARVRGPDEVFVAGERWRARRADGSVEPLEPGHPVRVVGRDGLSLLVEPAPEADDDAPVDPTTGSPTRPA
jgi:membrane-bound serine protease (ClpP class)